LGEAFLFFAARAPEGEIIFGDRGRKVAAPFFFGGPGTTLSLRAEFFGAPVNVRPNQRAKRVPPLV